MILVRLASLSLTMLLLGAGAQVAIGAEPVRHSGRILAIDTARGRLVLEEVGPWQVRDGVTQVIRRTITLTPTTEAAIVTRGNPAGGFASDFIEGRLDVDNLDVGDFVTVECRREGPRLVAVKIIVPDVTEPVGPQP